MAQEFRETLIRKHKVLEMTGWSNSTLYNRIATQQFKPGVKVGSRMVAWPLSEVEAYINARIAERDEQIGGGCMKEQKPQTGPVPHTDVTAQKPKQEASPLDKKAKRVKQPQCVDDECAVSPLPKAIKAVFRTIDEFGKRTGHLAVEAINQAGEVVLVFIDLKKVSSGNLEEIAALAVDGDLHPFQSRKGGNEL